MSEILRQVAAAARLQLLKLRRLETFDEVRLKIGEEDESCKIMSKRVAFGRVNIPPFVAFGRAGRVLHLYESPGSVILLTDEGEKLFSEVTVDGEAIESKPLRTITAAGKIYHVIERDEDGLLLTIDSIFATEKPEDTRTKKHLCVAEITKGKFWKITSNVAGSYTLTEKVALPAPTEGEGGGGGGGARPGGSGSNGSSGNPTPPGSGTRGSGSLNSGSSNTSSSSGSRSSGSRSSGSGSSSSSSKTAIIPFGKTFIGFEITESPNHRNRLVMVLPTDEKGTASALLDARWLATTNNTVFKAGCAVGIPALVHGRIHGNQVMVATSEPYPPRVVVTIEGDAAGEWSGPRFREFKPEEAESNGKFWRRAHGEA